MLATIPANVQSRLDPIAARSAQVSAVLARFSEPVSVAVTGRGGCGRTTMVAALAARGVRARERSASGSYQSADHRIHLLAGAVRPEDSRALGAAASPGSVTVVLAKADLYCEDRRERAAAACSAALGRPVMPVSGLLTLAASDGRWRDADLGDCRDAVATTPDSWSENLLRRFDRRGIDIVGRASTAEDARAALLAEGALGAVVARCVADPRWRALRLRNELSRLALSGVWRDELEQFLGGMHAQQWFDEVVA